MPVQELLHSTVMLQNELPAFHLPRAIGPASSNVISLEDRFRQHVPREATFRNPILPSPSADPWVIQHDGWYYYCESRHQDSIWIRKARCVTEVGHHEGNMVWSAPAFGPDAKSLWAPELHWIEGKWYIYYTADDGLNENHRMWVLEGLTNDPCGPYRLRGSLETSGWAIDGTVLKQADGSLYFVWSGWPGKENGQQNLYIAPMGNPWTLSAGRTLIAQPEQRWETVDMAICEGPQVLRRGERTFLVYSASGSWTEDYCLGLLELKGNDPLQPGSWARHGCVWSKTDTVWGLGHCSFVQSPDGSEDWIVYHAKSKRKKGWLDRNVRAQKFSWNRDGLPDFGEPAPPGASLSLPSGHSPVQVGL
jgi:GH43 family beta-xylosidase